ncbi:PqqD family protein [Blautia schinkii]|nr:PqqD family protein [Blautia schinkii]
MSKKKKKNEPQINYLDLIPERAESLPWHTDFKNRVILEVENTGVFNRIFQKLLNKPKYTKIHLDGQGSFIWPHIDGEKTVAELAALVKAEYGEAAEPLYPRIVKYFQILESYHFVKLKTYGSPQA